jgi:hypothetical protein
MGLGLTRPDNVDVADFLVDTAFAQPEKVLEGFRATPHYANSMALATSEPAALHTDHPLENRLIQASRYKRSWLSMLRVVTMRQWIVISRNTAFIKARVAQNVIMGLLLGALFFAIPFNQWYLISMVLMQVLSFMSFGTIAILPDVVAVRNVFYKQARENFFSPASYAVADYAVGLPFSCFDGFVLGSIVYFMANLSLSNNGGPYFVYLVICISYNVCMAQVIRYFAYTAPDRTMATAFAVLFLVMSIMFSGAVSSCAPPTANQTAGLRQVATPQVIPPCKPRARTDSAASHPALGRVHLDLLGLLPNGVGVPQPAAERAAQHKVPGERLRGVPEPERAMRVVLPLGAKLRRAVPVRAVRGLLLDLAPGAHRPGVPVGGRGHALGVHFGVPVHVRGVAQVPAPRPGRQARGHGRGRAAAGQ